MPEENLEIIVHVQHPGYKTKLRIKAPSLGPIGDLIKKLMAQLNIHDDFSTWELVLEERVLAYNASLGCGGGRGVDDSLVFILRKTTTKSPPLGPVSAAPTAAPPLAPLSSSFSACDVRTLNEEER
jgi:hypothetical protein